MLGAFPQCLHESCRRHFPAAFRKASLILSCQPGPLSWKCSRTSRSIRKDTTSLPPGILGGGPGTVSTGFFVTDLNAASAASLALSPRRLFRGGIMISSLPSSLLFRRDCLASSAFQGSDLPFYARGTGAHRKQPHPHAMGRSESAASLARDRGLSRAWKALS